MVNVASKCGLTPQYEALEKLHEKYHGKGFEVLGFPANNFAGQEPGSNSEISEFCTTNFGVQFPMFEKISVTGEDRHPLYAELTAEQPKAVLNEPSKLREISDRARNWSKKRSRCDVEFREIPDRSQWQGSRPLRAGRRPRRSAH